ncbi:MAG: cell division protein SepF, partial [Lachnospiraceae bacterium]|nr:cell division protein SepF [Lachnospiraceae bacterium]
MGVLDKFLNVMKLNPDDEDDFYDDDFYEEEEEEERKSFFRKKSDEEDDIFDDKSTKEKTSKTTPKLTPIRGGKKAGQNMEVCVIKPTSVDDAREITETLLENRTV